LSTSLALDPAGGAAEAWAAIARLKSPPAAQRIAAVNVEPRGLFNCMFPLR